MYINASFIFGMFVQLSLFWFFQHRSDAMVFGLLILAISTIKFVLDYAKQQDSKSKATSNILIPDSVSRIKPKKTKPKSLSLEVSKTGFSWKWI